MIHQAAGLGSAAVASPFRSLACAGRPATRHPVHGGARRHGQGRAMPAALRRERSEVSLKAPSTSPTRWPSPSCSTRVTVAMVEQATWTSARPTSAASPRAGSGAPAHELRSNPIGIFPGSVLEGSTPKTTPAGSRGACAAADRSGALRHEPPDENSMLAVWHHESWPQGRPQE